MSDPAFSTRLAAGIDDLSSQDATIPVQVRRAPCLIVRVWKVWRLPSLTRSRSRSVKIEVDDHLLVLGASSNEETGRSVIGWDGVDVQHCYGLR